MPRFPHVSRRGGYSPRWRRAALGAAAAVLAGGVPIALTDASTAAASTPTTPPPVTILTSQRGFGAGEDLFITPTGDPASYAAGPEILATNGRPVWFHAIPQGEASTDFRD